jgi:DNA-binding response OmpR family regulator
MISAIKKSLLVVDDEPIVQKFISKILMDAGYDVETAGNGAEALCLMNGKKFALILLDTNMPTMDGFQLLKIMRDNNINTPVIILSGEEQEELEDRGLSLKPSILEYLHKPVQPAQLLPKIKRMMEL